MEVAVRGHRYVHPPVLAVMPVRHCRMSSARRRHRGPALWPLACFLALALISLLGAGLARACDGTAPSASPPPATDSEAHADAGPVGGSVGAVKADSVAAAPAVRDSLEKTPGAPAKEPEPAEHIENASTPSAEKPGEAPSVPAGLTKPVDSPRIVPGGASAPKSTAPQASAPKAGTRTQATRGLRGSARRTV